MSSLAEQCSQPAGRELSLLAAKYCVMMNGTITELQWVQAILTATPAGAGSRLVPMSLLPLRNATRLCRH